LECFVCTARLCWAVCFFLPFAFGTSRSDSDSDGGAELPVYTDPDSVSDSSSLRNHGRLGRVLVAAQSRQVRSCLMRPARLEHNAAATAEAAHKSGQSAGDCLLSSASASRMYRLTRDRLTALMRSNSPALYSLRALEGTPCVRWYRVINRSSFLDSTSLFSSLSSLLNRRALRSLL